MVGDEHGAAPPQLGGDFIEDILSSSGDAKLITTNTGTI
jgi:hypothetical protein